MRVEAKIWAKFGMEYGICKTPSNISTQKLISTNSNLHNFCSLAKFIETVTAC